MKKIAMFAVLVLTTVACTNRSPRMDGMGHMGKMAGPGMECPAGAEGMHMNKMKMGKNFKMNPEMQAIHQKHMTVIQGKRQELQKLMAEKNPDWAKIEKLNFDIAHHQAEMKLQMMKSQKTVK